MCPVCTIKEREAKIHLLYLPVFSPFFCFLSKFMLFSLSLFCFWTLPIHMWIPPRYIFCLFSRAINLMTCPLPTLPWYDFNGLTKPLLYLMVTVSPVDWKSILHFHHSAHFKVNQDHTIFLENRLPRTFKHLPHGTLMVWFSDPAVQWMFSTLVFLFF